MASKDEGDTALTVEEVPAELDAVEPASLAGRGQGMVARRDIAAGEALVSETALASIVFDEWGHLVCHQCFAALPLSKDKKIPCGGCLMVCYCSEGCQAAAAPLHDSECAALARLDTDILNPAEASSARLFVKLLCRRADELADAEGDGGSAVQACLDALVTNEEAMSDERMIELEMVVEAVNEAVGRDAEMDGDALLGYLCAAQCNSFSIWAQNGVCPSGQLLGKRLGFGLFPTLAKLNHSCLPNATVSEQAHGHRRLLTARALTNIPQGEEVVISYSAAGLLLAPEQRAAWLLRSFLFTCRCELCAAPSEEAKGLVKRFNTHFRCVIKACAGLRYPLLDAEGVAKGDGVVVCGRCLTLDAPEVEPDGL